MEDKIVSLSLNRSCYPSTTERNTLMKMPNFLAEILKGTTAFVDANVFVFASENPNVLRKCTHAF
ncbi:MAG: hypothetical protein B6U94_07455 [Thermofilum sp. ex4484_79]|nr:MAG: hypothetical protein B6U94_07455 [Thermofilum sp. ex4484_79]